MMTPLGTGGGDQEKFTCLCPATASNISGVPSGGSPADNGHCNSKRDLRKAQTELYNIMCTTFYKELC